MVRGEGADGLWERSANEGSTRHSSEGGDTWTKYRGKSDVHGGEMINPLTGDFWTEWGVIMLLNTERKVIEDCITRDTYATSLCLKKLGKRKQVQAVSKSGRRATGCKEGKMGKRGTNQTGLRGNRKRP